MARVKPANRKPLTVRERQRFLDELEQNARDVTVVQRELADVTRSSVAALGWLWTRLLLAGADPAAERLAFERWLRAGGYHLDLTPIFDASSVAYPRTVRPASATLSPVRGTANKGRKT